MAGSDAGQSRTRQARRHQDRIRYAGIVDGRILALDEGIVQICYIRKVVFVVHLADVKRDSGFEYVPQAQRELTDRAVAFDEIVSDLNQFQIAWKTGETPQTLSARFRFKKVHDAECERRGSCSMRSMFSEENTERSSHGSILTSLVTGCPFSRSRAAHRARFVSERRASGQ